MRVDQGKRERESLHQRFKNLWSRLRGYKATLEHRPAIEEGYSQLRAEFARRDELDAGPTRLVELRERERLLEATIDQADSSMLPLRDQ